MTLIREISSFAIMELYGTYFFDAILINHCLGWLKSFCINIERITGGKKQRNKRQFYVEYPNAASCWLIGSSRALHASSAFLLRRWREGKSGYHGNVTNATAAVVFKFCNCYSKQGCLKCLQSYNSWQFSKMVRPHRSTDGKPKAVFTRQLSTLNIFQSYTTT